jgi:hypothetical protein
MAESMTGADGPTDLVAESVIIDAVSGEVDGGIATDYYFVDCDL